MLAKISRAHLAVVAVLAVALQGCGGCSETPPEAPPKPVRGNAPETRAAAPQPVLTPQEPKEICAVLVFSNVEGGPAPLSVQLTSEGDCTSGQARVEWDFADGSPGATGETVVHTFEKPGTYTVKGKITSDELPGVEDFDDVEIVVTAPQG